MLEAPHCRGEGVFIQCIIRGFSSPFQRNVAPEMCRGLEGGSVGRVYVQAAPLAWSQRGWIHAANATPVGHCVGRGWERVWGGSRTGPPRIRPLSALTPRPCTAPSLSIPLSLICQRNGEERVISAPAPSRPRAAPPGRWQHGIAFCVTRPGPPPAPFGAVDESQIRGGGTSFTSERVRGGRRLRGWREGGWSCVFGEQNKARELLCAVPLSPDVTHSCRGVQH